MTSLKSKRQMPPLRGEGVTCPVLRCTHSRYENLKSPSSTRDQDSLQLAPIAALNGRRLIEKAAHPFSDCDQEHTLDLTY